MTINPKKRVRQTKSTTKSNIMVKYNNSNRRKSTNNKWLKYSIAGAIVIATITYFALKNKPISLSKRSNDNSVNVIQQAKQTIVVIPSDILLRKCGALTSYESMGKTLYNRDYQSFLLSGSDNKQITTTIQRSFSDSGYPLVDLEQSLKSQEIQSMLDAADGLNKDAKTLLLSTTRPDIIIEFDYDVAIQLLSRGKGTTMLSYNIILLDAFSNKSIGSINNPGIQVTKNDIGNVSAILNKEIENNLPQLSVQVKKYFSDIETNGREITFTVSLHNSSQITMQDMYNSNGDSYADWIRNWVRANAKLGTATMQRNTSSEMNFVNVRINNIQEDGQQFNAYEFADKFRRDFYKTFQIQVENSSQGLATAHLIIK